ncbi:MAG: hypothetical protein FJY85_22510 [Deltaproteobacteria bacterium]|nr:hypothetical protein [Chloroflexota bacterium]MBM3302710.1 hypothetical protein [Deltaproteobacteria bacterium]
MSDREAERLRQLRDRQIADRDPLVKQHKFQHDSAIKERRMRKPFSLVKAWKDFPHVVKVPLYGLVLGILVLILLPDFWPSPYALLVGGAITVILLLFGVVTGNALDLRDSIRDNLK